MNHAELLQYVTKEIKNNHDVDINYTIKGKSYLIKFMSPNYLRKINIPCILAIPQEISSDKLVLEVNVSETDNLHDSLEHATEEVFKLTDLTRSKSAPILVPVLPFGENSPDFRQLSKECFELSKNDPKYRIDEQVIRMIEQARKFVKRESEIDLADRIFLNGDANTSVFAQRFALIHPELIDTACIESASVPLPSPKAGYPIGTQDYEELFGKQFDIRRYLGINFKYYDAKLESEFVYNTYKLLTSNKNMETQDER